MNKNSRGYFWSKWRFVVAALSVVISARAQTNSNLSITNPAPAPRRPSILLILADNVGYGDLGCYGQTKIKTPNLDKLAGEGIRFTSYYTGSPEDQPARASLLTGLEPRNIGSSFSHPLPMDAFTVAILLQQGGGYHNGFIGEWNLGDTPPVQPMAKGFNEFAGFLSQAHARDYFTDSIYRQDTDTGSNRVEALAKNWNNSHRIYVPDLLGDAATNFVQNNAPSFLNHHRAFFLCLAYPIPHNTTAPADSTYFEESWPQAEKDRATLITRMDESIGRLMDILANDKLDTNTVVIFTSIGGPKQEGAADPKFFNSAGPLRGHAGGVYEGGIRVPMIIRWPARIKPGQVSDFPWTAWDFLPTAADIALIKPTVKTDGISILPVLTRKGKAGEHKSFHWEANEDGPQQAVRMGDWKMVRIATNAPELYNLKTDIGETNDVATKHPDLVKKLDGALK